MPILRTGGASGMALEASSPRWGRALPFRTSTMTIRKKGNVAVSPRTPLKYLPMTESPTPSSMPPSSTSHRFSNRPRRAAASAGAMSNDSWNAFSPAMGEIRMPPMPAKTLPIIQLMAASRAWE